MVRSHTEDEMWDKIDQIESDIPNNGTCDRNVSSITFDTPSYYNEENKNDKIIVFLRKDTHNVVKTDIINFFLLECSVQMELDGIVNDTNHLTFELLK